MWMEYLRRICIFLLIAETLLKLCPSSKYEDYMRMITGLICMIMILFPLASLIRMDHGMELPQIGEFERQLQEVMEEGTRQMQDRLLTDIEEGDAKMRSQIDDYMRQEGWTDEADTTYFLE